MLRAIQSRLLNLSRVVKQSIVMLIDVAASVFATWAAFSLRLDTLHWPIGYQWYVYGLAPLIALPVFIRLGLYHAIFRYTGLSAMVAVGKAVTLCGALFFLLLLLLTLPDVPRSVGLMQPIILLILVGASRVFARFGLIRMLSARRRHKQVRMLVYGAGEAGVQVAEALLRGHEFEIIGFLDDDSRLVGKTINGKRIYSSRNVAEVIEQHAITDVLLALPSLPRPRRNEILSYLRQFQLHVRSLPDLADLAAGKVTVSDIHDLDINDLLGRDPVPPDSELLRRNIVGKTVMVSGAGGSIGGELSRQILAERPDRLLLLDHNEFGLYAIHEDLKKRMVEMAGEVVLVPLLASIRDMGRLQEIFSVYRPHAVYHAAAYKHVPLVEHNVAEGTRNNVFGTLNLASVAVEHGVANFVLISTDKAVRPTNVMGATKRLAEMILQAFNEEATCGREQSLALDESRKKIACKTKFSMVRFGNVLGSSGSVVPLFRQQIREGGPITLTDEEVTRYFMTIPEAAQLVIQAGAMAKGGDVFVLDMGAPVKIYDLATRMIELSGLSVCNEANPQGDISIKITGMRPGEKLYEELLIGENPQPTAHVRIMKAHEDFLAWDILKPYLQKLQKAADCNDIEEVRLLMSELVSGYRFEKSIVDWVHVANEDAASEEYFRNSTVERLPS
ncbi:nucleoside-diphosphate sugar epimerase/dehydratase [Herbaspirillum sp. WKF16]|uniref:polysaccharide biosynthesis protein n=1 Tax=Herbaspirillum sp. WKF16 TaxID=3028312 RepID=UPI0023A9DE87|nr:nucleoside-diphosphate sugar epimerase/dehydratase [Herbaspirillum sp. WKF16]WDZ96614.1 nucleoside-diphosphate sugar epimerase/dehydratase [Herbaspirillum sp. WKF16]